MTRFFERIRQKAADVSQPPVLIAGVDTDTSFTALNAAVVEFLKKYPVDAKGWEAKLIKAQAEAFLAGLAQPGFDETHALTLAREVAEDKSASDIVRQDADYFLLRMALQNDPENIEKISSDYQKKHPEDGRVDGLRLSYALHFAEKEPAKAAAIYQGLLSSKNVEVASFAKAALQMMNMVGKPVDLKFTAVGGEEVDLSKMIGKVALIDFWATWCGPCMEEMPSVVTAYHKYHDKGFEVVGISLDHDKDKLLTVTKEKGMTWPQYFDGEGWQNEVAQRFGVLSIPRLWLINKKGEIATIDARRNLDEQVEKLLAQ